MTTPHDFDFIVLGAGSGGVRFARLAAARGQRVAVVEGDSLGGTCVHRGCVPKKLLMLASKFSSECADAAGLGWTVGAPVSNWAALRDGVLAELTRLDGVYQRLLTQPGAEIIRGWGRFVDAHTVGVFSEGADAPARTLRARATITSLSEGVDGGSARERARSDRPSRSSATATEGVRTKAARWPASRVRSKEVVFARVLSARRIIIATGARPLRPPIPGAELAVVSDDLFHLPRLPGRCLIVGAGYIGTEFAGILNGLGVDVTLACRAERVLNHFDPEVSDFLARGMAERGVTLSLKNAVARIEATPGGGRKVTFASGATLETDLVVLSVGRRPNTDRLELGRAGVETDAYGAVRVDAYGRTTIPSVFAVGDVTGHAQLTPVALAEASALLSTLLDDRPQTIDYASVATAVFSQPPVATCGLTEREAREKGRTVRVFATDFRPLVGALTGRAERTFLKVVVDAPSDRVLGIHLVGADTPEIMQGFAVALRAGLTKADLDATLGIHPTAAEELCTLRTPRD